MRTRQKRSIIQNSLGYNGIQGEIAVIRYLSEPILQDLEKKMVFIGGPRQVGKTTLAKSFISSQYKDAVYLNWDIDEDRRAILSKEWRKDASLVIFDEIHKYPKWKQWIKGVYDGSDGSQTYLVIGSARLDVYKKGGDSLLGRYHYWRLHPFSLDELSTTGSLEENYHKLLNLGGFPEPFLSGDERTARRWRRERFDRIIKEDIRDLEPVKSLQMLGLYIDLLRQRVGSMITFSNLARDLEVSPKTAKSWLEICENMYLCFAVSPYTVMLERAIKKPPKVYFFDNADVLSGEAAKLENLVATHLLKRLHFIEDYEGYRCSLHYVRDRDSREVDFLTVVDGKVEDLIEVKLTDKNLSKSLVYYGQKLKPKRVTQIVGNLERSFHKNDVLVTNPIDFFTNVINQMPCF